MAEISALLHQAVAALQIPAAGQGPLDPQMTEAGRPGLSSFGTAGEGERDKHSATHKTTQRPDRQ